MLIVAFFWAVGHPLGRIILKQVHPFQLASINLIIGFVSVLIYTAVTGRLRELKTFSFKDILYSLLLGIIGFFLYQLFTFSALHRIPASMNAVLITTNVIFITIFAALLLKERLSLLRVLGILSAATGAVFVVFNQGFVLGSDFNFSGSIFSILAAVSSAVYSLGGKKILSRHDPISVVLIALFSGTLFLTLFTAVTTGFAPLEKVNGSTWALIIGLGLGMIGLAYPLWFYCLKRVNASEVSIFIYLVPFFAGVLSFFILNERFGWRFYFGAALILSGIFLANFLSRRSAGRTSPSTRKT